MSAVFSHINSAGGSGGTEDEEEVQLVVNHHTFYIEGYKGDEETLTTGIVTPDTLWSAVIWGMSLRQIKRILPQLLGMIKKNLKVTDNIAIVNGVISEQYYIDMPSLATILREVYEFISGKIVPVREVSYGMQAAGAFVSNTVHNSMLKTVENYMNRLRFSEGENAELKTRVEKLAKENSELTSQIVAIRLSNSDSFVSEFLDTVSSSTLGKRRRELEAGPSSAMGAMEGRASAMMGRASAMTGRASAMMGRASAMMGRASPFVKLPTGRVSTAASATGLGSGAFRPIPRSPQIEAVEEAKKALAEKTKEAESWEAKYNERTTDLANAAVEIENNLRIAREINASNDALKAKNRELEAKNRELEEKNRELEEKNKTLETEKKDFDEKLKEAKEANEKLKEENKTLKEKKDKAKMKSTPADADARSDVSEISPEFNAAEALNAMSTGGNGRSNTVGKGRVGGFGGRGGSGRGRN